MDENEILSRLDARGRAAAGGVHDALADTPVPLFDPEVHPVSFDGSPRRWARFRWMSAAGIVALALVAAVAVLVVDGDDGDSPADRVGTVEPPRRFVAGHLPDGFEVTGVFDRSSDALEPADAESSTTLGPLVLYGPDPSRPELAVTVTRTDVFAPEEELPSEVVTVGDRRLEITSAAGIVAHAGLVEVDGHEVAVLAKDRALLEAVAGTVEVGGDDRPVVAATVLPDGWEELGEFGPGFGPVTAMRSAFDGERWSVAYERDSDAMLLVTSSEGGALDVAAERLFSTSWEDVEVRGRPAVLSHVDLREVMDSEEKSLRTWAVTWEERPGEVLRVVGYGASSEDVLAVAEGLVPADDAVWDEVTRQSLRSVVGLDDDEVLVLGEGEFSDGSPWVLMVQRMWAGTEGDPTGEEGVGGAIDGGEPVLRRHLQVRTTARQSTGMSSGSTGGTRGGLPNPLEGISVEGGDDLAWVYGFVSAEVATVELVDVDGEIRATARVLRAEDYHGFLLEVDLNLVELRGFEITPEGAGDEDTATETTWSQSPSTTAGPVTESDDGGSDRPQLVARAADGAELGRKNLP